MTDWPWIILVGLYGACVGSFLNVVVYRLPIGKSLIHPPSHCPSCNNQLALWENIPVLAWFFLGGKCSHCKSKISFQYPAIEALTAFLFLVVALVYYHTTLHDPFAAIGLEASWPVLAVHLIMVGGLLAATLIDAEHYIIPLGIPYVVIMVALVVYPGFAYLRPEVAIETVTMPLGGGVRIAAGGLAGLILANVLLRFGLIPLSFADEEQWLREQEQLQATEEKDSDSELEKNQEKELEQGTPIDAYLRYPFARREMFKEALFLAIPFVGMILGYLFIPWEGDGGPLVLRAVAGVVLGYLVGGGAIWLTRILGTFSFNKEAMGLGDVHLLAAVGAVLGPMDPLFVFFIAPFFGLAAALICFGLSRIYRGRAKVIPYGPYLAGATLVVMLFRDPIVEALF